ncbi:MAG: UDP-glucose 4-epimerase GalE [Deltaproteobacteria bacterium]|nr:UDP-glucose 4-epimerase GalE [Deltaproteobacteria bacterium]
MILIAGGAGYIGSHANKLFNQRGYDTVVFDNLVYGHRSFVRWGDFVLGDLADRDQLRLCFSKYPIEAVMHFCGFAYVGESVSDPAKYYRNNVMNTLNLLDTMREFDVPYIIFSSTCSTYGVPQRIPLTEDHPQSPINPYGWSKFMIEQILKDYNNAYGIKYTNLRYFNAAGADPDAEVGERHDPETHLIPLILDVAAGKRPDVKIFGTDYETPDGTCVRDYIHVTDLSDAHILALDYLRRGGPSDSFNLGNGNGFSVREVIRTAEIITGCDIKSVEADRRAGDPPVLVGSARKAQDVLNWHPQFADLTAIIQTAWRWRQKE